MTAALDSLGRAVGLSTEAMLEIAAQVKGNSERLNACARHDFEPVPGKLKFGNPSRYRCKHCQGEVDNHAWYWHEKGRATAAS
jgi:hypothetical protein